MGTLTKTILVVDDEDAIRWLIRIALERDGYSVLDAADGEHALEIFRDHGPNIKMLLSDVAMPKMNGVNLADKILQIEPTLPVLFISGDHTDVSRGFGCVSKPFTPDKLVERVREILTDESEPLKQATHLNKPIRSVARLRSAN